MKIKQDDVKGIWIGMDDFYFDVLDAISNERKTNLQQFTVIEISDKLELDKLKIPVKIYTLAKELNMSVDQLISKVLCNFVIEYTMGYSKYKKGILNRIKKYPELELESKMKLLQYLLEKE